MYIYISICHITSNSQRLSPSPHTCQVQGSRSATTAPRHVTQRGIPAFQRTSRWDALRLGLVAEDFVKTCNLAENRSWKEHMALIYDQKPFKRRNKKWFKFSNNQRFRSHPPPGKVPVWVSFRIGNAIRFIIMLMFYGHIQASSPCWYKPILVDLEDEKLRSEFRGIHIYIYIYILIYSII